MAFYRWNENRRKERNNLKLNCFTRCRGPHQLAANGSRVMKGRGIHAVAY